MSFYRYLVVILGLLSLSTPVITAQVDPLQQTACRFRLPGRVQVDCYTLFVPENRENPESGNIQLALAILRHPDGNPEADPILFLQGGPGGGTLDTLFQTYSQRFEPLLAANRDIILLDQRGVGRSTPNLECPAYVFNRRETVDFNFDGLGVSASDIQELLNDSLITCGNTLSNLYDLSGYNSVQNAADIESLRVALGYEQLNLWGISYGTRLAMTAMRDYPESFRRVVLDSVYPLEVNLFSELPTNFDRALNTLFEACHNDSTCNDTYPNLETVLYQTVNELNRRPIRFDVPNVIDDDNDFFTDVVFNGNLLMDVLFQLLYVTDALPSLPELIYQASDRDTTSWGAILGWYIGQRDGVSLGMYYAVQCQEEISFTAEGAITEAWSNFPQFDFYLNTLRDVEVLGSICGAFNAGTSPYSENMAFSSEIPSLLFSGEFDPITPPAWAQQTADVFPNSIYFNLPYSGHGVSGSTGCAQSMMIEFFITETPDAINSSCLDDLSIVFTGTQIGDFNAPNGANGN